MQSANYNRFLTKIVFNLPQHNPRQKRQRTVENCLTFKILFCGVNYILAGLLSLLALDSETLTSLAFVVVKKQAESAEEVGAMAQPPSAPAIPLGQGFSPGATRRCRWPLRSKSAGVRSLRFRSLTQNLTGCLQQIVPLLPSQSFSSLSPSLAAVLRSCACTLSAFCSEPIAFGTTDQPT